MKISFTRLLTLATIPVFIFSLIFISCQKELQVDLGSGPPINTPITVEGVITDASGVPLQNVQVKAGSVQVMTDINGSFRATDALFTTDETFVIATKQGYFTGSRTFFARATGNNFLRIRLLPRTEVASVSGTSGGVAIFNGSTVSFPANAFATTSGASYTGNVSVKAVYLDPTSALINQQMPGDLRGVRTTGELRGLKSFGMINVELEGAGGEKLQLRSGITAEINLPIPAGLTNNSPATVPLWFFNEATGLWKEEGIAQKQGNSYKGSVSHFTFWNVDEPYQYVLLGMKVVNQAQQAIGGARVELTSLADSTNSFDYTDNTGSVNGYVPINVTLRRDIYNECNALVSSTVIGPFSSNTDLGTVQVTSVVNLQTVTGTVTNCSGGPVTQGHVIISMPGNTVYANVVNGAFSAIFTSCAQGGSATVVAIDDSLQVQSSLMTISLANPVVATGVLQACGVTAQEFITLTVDGVTRTWNTSPYDFYAIEDPLLNGGFYSIYIAAYDSITGGAVDLNLFRSETSPLVPPIGVGIESISVYDQLATPGMTGDYFVDLIQQPATLTEYGPVGTFMTGSFSGRFIRSSGPIVDTAQVSCSWKIRREPW